MCVARRLALLVFAAEDGVASLPFENVGGLNGVDRPASGGTH